MPSVSFTLPSGTDLSGVISERYGRGPFSRALVYKKGDKSFLVGFNRCVMAVTPVEVEGGDLVGVVPATTGGKSFLKAKRKPVGVKYDAPASVGDKGTVSVKQSTSQSVYAVEPFDGQLQNAKAILGDVKLTGCVSLTLDVNQLTALAKAVSDSGRVTLFVPTDKERVAGVVSVVGHRESGPKGIGLIMPVVVEGDLKGFFLDVAGSIPDCSEVPAPEQ